MIGAPGFTGNAPGGPSRWSTKRSGEWVPLKPKLVVEVCYDHFSGDRFRHGTRLLRWRPDKAPKQCSLDQVKQKKAKLITLLDSTRILRAFLYSLHLRHPLPLPLHLSRLAKSLP